MFVLSALRRGTTLSEVISAGRKREQAGPTSTCAVFASDCSQCCSLPYQQNCYYRLDPTTAIIEDDEIGRKTFKMDDSGNVYCDKCAENKWKRASWVLRCVGVVLALCWWEYSLFVDCRQRIHHNSISDDGDDSCAAKLCLVGVAMTVVPIAVALLLTVVALHGAAA